MKKLIIIFALATVHLVAAPQPNPKRTSFIIVDYAPPVFSKSTLFKWLRYYFYL